jgi:hypothetical protein
VAEHVNMKVRWAQITWKGLRTLPRHIPLPLHFRSLPFWRISSQRPLINSNPFSFSAPSTILPPLLLLLPPLLLLLLLLLLLCCSSVQRHYPNCPTHPLGPGLPGRSATLRVWLSHHRCCQTPFQDYSTGITPCNSLSDWLRQHLICLVEWNLLKEILQLIRCL